MVSMGDEQHLPLGTIENQHVVNCTSERAVCVWLGGVFLADPECFGMCQGLFLGWDSMTSGCGMGGCAFNRHSKPLQ